MNLSGISELLSEIFLGKITKTDEKKLTNSRKRFWIIVNKVDTIK